MGKKLGKKGQFFRKIIISLVILHYNCYKVHIMLYYYI